MLVGMSAYGKSMCDTSGLYATGRACNSDDFVNFRNMGEWRQFRSDGYYVANRDKYLHHHYNHENKLVGAYWYDPVNRHFASLETTETARAKTAYAAEKGLAGYFFWVSRHDYNNELHYAAYEGFTGRYPNTTTRSKLFKNPQW
eukprot:Trichotokara_eunicae@DN6251_c0_g1_i6.p1